MTVVSGWEKRDILIHTQDNEHMELSHTVQETIMFAATPARINYYANDCHPDLSLSGDPFLEALSVTRRSILCLQSLLVVLDGAVQGESF